MLIAGVCAWLVYRIVSVRIGGAKPVATTRVVAAAKDIPLGSVLTAADLADDDAGGHAAQGRDYETGRRDWPGRDYADRPGRADSGQPIGGSWLRRRTGADDSAQGMRACAVRVDEVVGVSGFVIPGMRVDVLVSATRRAPPPSKAW